MLCHHLMGTGEIAMLRRRGDHSDEQLKAAASAFPSTGHLIALQLLHLVR
jgi:hypothetical protein